MTFVDKLLEHKGSLICLKSEIFWFHNNKHCDATNRICLLLDAAFYKSDVAATSYHANSGDNGALLLLIDNSVKWIWLAEHDIEILDETR